MNSFFLPVIMAFLLGKHILIFLGIAILPFTGDEVYFSCSFIDIHWCTIKYLCLTCLMSCDSHRPVTAAPWARLMMDMFSVVSLTFLFLWAYFYMFESFAYSFLWIDWLFLSVVSPPHLLKQGCWPFSSLFLRGFQCLLGILTL